MSGKTSVVYHPDLRSCGEIDRKVIDAFVNHSKPFDRDQIVADDCRELLQHRNEYFPHINDMFLDVTRGLVHVTAGFVNTGSLFTYLSETRSSIQAVEVSIPSLSNRLVIPLYIISSLLPDVSQTATLQAISAAINKSKDVILPVFFGQVDSVPSACNVLRIRDVVRFQRNRYWREWIALIRILEGDPVVDYPRQIYRPQRPVKLQQAISRSPVPANPEVFKVVRKSRSFHAEKVDDIDMHLKRLLRISAARKFK